MVVDIPDIVTYTNFGDHRLRGFWVAGGQISPSPIDFHRRPYNTLALPCERVNHAFILYRFRDIAGYLSKVADFDPPHLHLVPPVEFRGDLWLRKTRVPVLSCGVVCVILRLAVLVEHRLVTDRWTDRQTDTGPWLVLRMHSIAR